MDFQSQAQKDCYLTIAPWMKELFGSFVAPREDIPFFAVAAGTAMAQVGVYPWGEDDATITTRAYVVTDVELTPDLLKFLLSENDRMRFGAFGIDSEQDIFFEHTILGSTVEKDELKSSVMAVIITADAFDDKIVERWGGQRMGER